ncbi:hypothetical protein C4J81_08025 [Deltaproteobacteria bacterium Smac51]|nr:hypothetical protein C4J81_08025 [Deltaproteobacteria bacterium Smac51]
MTALLPALSGANIIYGLGLIELGMTMDYAQLLIDADMAEMVMFALGGIPVTDQTLAVDVINQVGPFKDFLSHKSTFEFRRSQSQPRLFNRQVRDTWLKKGGRDLTAVALDKAKEILETHQPIPLSDETRTALRKIVNAAEKSHNLPLSDQ